MKIKNRIFYTMKQMHWEVMILTVPVKHVQRLWLVRFRNSFFNVDTISKHQKAIASVRAGNVIGGGDCSDDRIIPDIVRALTPAKNN